MPEQNEVKRYGFYGKEKEGYWVQFSDYAALQAKCEQLGEVLKDTISSWKAECQQLEMRVKAGNDCIDVELAKNKEQEKRIKELEEALKDIETLRDCIDSGEPLISDWKYIERLCRRALNPKPKTEEK